LGQSRVEEERIAAARERVTPALEEARRRFGHVLDAEASLAVLRRRISAASGTTARAVDSLHQAVAEAGLQAGRFAYQPEVIDELGLLELQATMPVTGSYASLRNLIFLLGTGQAFTAIDSIELAATGQAGAAGSLTIELNLSTFVADPEAHPAGTTGTGAQPRRPRGVTDEIDDPAARVEEIHGSLASLPALPGPTDAYDVHLDELDKMSPEARVPQRNLFAFGSRSAPAPSRPPTEEQQQPPATTPAPPPTRVAFNLIGIVDMPSGRRATLIDGRGLYIVAAGDELPGGLRVASVGLDYVELDVRGTLVRLTLEIEIP
jgi:hypothetical protein